MKLRTLARPKVVLPLVMTGALLFVAFSLGDVGKVLDRLRSIPLTSLAVTLGFAAGYLLLKGIQLRRLLRKLGSPMKWRLFLLAFSVGELAANLPLGIFAQNWVLSRQPSAHFARSSAATSFMLMTELAVALLLVAVVGIPGWGWLRPVAVLVLAGLGGLLFALIHFEPLLHDWDARTKRKWLHALLDDAMDLIGGLKRLSRGRVLVVNVVLASAYLGMLVWAFVIVGHAMGVQPLPYLQAAVVYAFSLAVVLMGGGIVGQVGSMEVLGMNAAHAWGIGYTDGLALMLGFRLVWIGSIWLLAGPVVLWLHRYVQPDAQGSGDGSGEKVDDVSGGTPDKSSGRMETMSDMADPRRAAGRKRCAANRCARVHCAQRSVWPHLASSRDRRSRLSPLAGWARPGVVARLCAVRRARLRFSCGLSRPLKRAGVEGVASARPTETCR